MASPTLLKPKKVFVRLYKEVSHSDMMKLVRAGKRKMYGFLEVAYEVEEIGTKSSQPCYNVRMEYTLKG